VTRNHQILVAERHVLVVHRNQAMVGDGHPVGIAAQIVEHLRRSGKRSFGIDNPLFVSKCCHQPGKGLTVRHGGDLAVKAQSAFLIQLLQMVEVRFAELLGQGFSPEQIPLSGRHPAGSVESPNPGRNQAVQMKMIDQGLGPDMQHADNAQLPLKTPAGVGGKSLKGLVDAAEQVVQQLPWITVDDQVEIMGQGEDQMKIAGGQQLAPAGIEPAFLGQCAAFGTVTVAAAVANIALEPALVALLPVTAHHGGPATADMMHGLQVL